MYEIEIKSRVGDLRDLENRIRDLGGEFKNEIFQEDFYFQHPCRDFRKTDEALRIRKERDEVFITYKGPRIDRETKTRAEIEIKTDEKIIDMLKGLGFTLAGTVKKTRKNYILNGLGISLDSVENLGYFVEIETSGDLESGKAKILNLAGILGLKDLERRSYFEMIGEIKNEHK